MIDRWQLMAAHSRYELFAMTGIIDIGIHQKRARSTLYKISERGFEVGVCAGICDYDALIQRACGPDNILGLGLHIRIGPIDQQANDGRARDHLPQHLKPLSKRSACDHADTRDIAAW